MDQKARVISAMDEILVYPGAGWDLSFPIYGTTILLDQQPDHSFWKDGSRGSILAQNFLATLQNLMARTFPGCSFLNVPSEQLWKWTHSIHGWTIYYFHSHRIGVDPLPELAKMATMLWMKRFPCEELVKQLPRLLTITGPSDCTCWIKDPLLRNRFIPHKTTQPLSTLSDKQLAQLRVDEELLIQHLTPIKPEKEADEANETDKLAGLRSSLRMIMDGDTHQYYPDRSKRESANYNSNDENEGDVSDEDFMPEHNDAKDQKSTFMEKHPALIGKWTDENEGDVSDEDFMPEHNDAKDQKSTFMEKHPALIGKCTDGNVTRIQNDDDDDHDSKDSKLPAPKPMYHSKTKADQEDDDDDDLPLTIPAITKRPQRDMKLQDNETRSRRGKRKFAFVFDNDSDSDGVNSVQKTATTVEKTIVVESSSSSESEDIDDDKKAQSLEFVSLNKQKKRRQTKDVGVRAPFMSPQRPSLCDVNDDE